MNVNDSRRKRTLVLGIALTIAAFLLVIDLFVSPHLSFNHTNSMPRGFYWRTEVPAGGPNRGDIVIACAPPRFANYGRSHDFLEIGPCDGVTTLLKRVVAIMGDRVHLDARGVRVNRSVVAGSAPATISGSPIPHIAYGDYLLGPHEVWLASPKVKSFDSRYFGPVTAVLAIATPLLVEWSETHDTR